MRNPLTNNFENKTDRGEFLLAAQVELHANAWKIFFCQLKMISNADFRSPYKEMYA